MTSWPAIWVMSECANLPLFSSSGITSLRISLIHTTPKNTRKLSSVGVLESIPCQIQSSGKSHSVIWVGLCISSWWPWFWSVDSIYCYIHAIRYSCIQSNWNEPFVRDIYIPRVGVAMTVCWMIRYCYSFLPGFKCIFQKYSSGFSISQYGYKCHVTLCIGQLHPITVYMTVFWVCVVLVLSGIMCSLIRWYHFSSW